MIKSKKKEEIIVPNLGPEGFNSQLVINFPLLGIIATSTFPISIDVETDENDNFVGIAICYSDDKVYYYSDLESIKYLLGDKSLIGHGFKFDMHMLKKWGINVKPEQMFFERLCTARP